MILYYQLHSLFYYLRTAFAYLEFQPWERERHEDPNTIINITSLNICSCRTMKSKATAQRKRPSWNFSCVLPYSILWHTDPLLSSKQQSLLGNTRNNRIIGLCNPFLSNAWYTHFHGKGHQCNNRTVFSKWSMLRFSCQQFS